MRILSYLKIKRLRLGLLVNFNVAELRQGIKRVICRATAQGGLRGEGG
ncbi:MAG TPA: GxxExxY protein [Polyangiaceae bacterium]|nr:GxxExxY protein [Polyangiaceae bacterium]